MGVYATCIEWDSNGRVQERKNVEMKPRTSRNASGLECDGLPYFLHYGNRLR